MKKLSFPPGLTSYTEQNIKPDVCLRQESASNALFAATPSIKNFSVPKPAPLSSLNSMS